MVVHDILLFKLVDNLIVLLVLIFIQYIITINVKEPWTTSNHGKRVHTSKEVNLDSIEPKFAKYNM